MRIRVPAAGVKVPEARLAVGAVKVTVAARGTGVDKQEADENPLHQQERKFDLEVPQRRGEGQWGVAKRTVEIAIVKKWQKVTVSGGIELPWFIRTDSEETIKSDSVAGFRYARSLVEKEMAGELGDIEEMLALVVERSQR